MFQIEVDGFDRMQKNFSPANFRGVVRTLMRGAAAFIEDEVADYPASSAANRSPGVNGYSWYERGFGTRTVTGRSYASSENLGKSWTTKISANAGFVEGVVGTTVSYAQWVQGEKQTGFHNARGWVTVKDVAEQQMGKIKAWFQAGIVRALNG